MRGPAATSVIDTTRSDAISIVVRRSEVSSRTDSIAEVCPCCRGGPRPCHLVRLQDHAGEDEGQGSPARPPGPPSEPRLSDCVEPPCRVLQGPVGDHEKRLRHVAELEMGARRVTLSGPSLFARVTKRGDDSL